MAKLPSCWCHRSQTRYATLYELQASDGMVLSAFESGIVSDTTRHHADRTGAIQTGRTASYDAKFSREFRQGWGDLDLSGDWYYRVFDKETLDVTGEAPAEANYPIRDVCISGDSLYVFRDDFGTWQQPARALPTANGVLMLTNANSGRLSEIAPDGSILQAVEEPTSGEDVLYYPRLTLSQGSTRYLASPAVTWGFEPPAGVTFANIIDASTLSVQAVQAYETIGFWTLLGLTADGSIGIAFANYDASPGTYDGLWLCDFGPHGPSFFVPYGRDSTFSSPTGVALSGSPLFGAPYIRGGLQVADFTEDRLFIHGKRGTQSGIHCYAIADGAHLWSYPFSQYSLSTIVQSYQGDCVFMQGHQVGRLSGADGTLLWELQTPVSGNLVGWQDLSIVDESIWVSDSRSRISQGE